MTNRTCTKPYCSRPHRAKGLCVTHYNQAQGESARHPKVTKPCAVCAIPVRRRVDNHHVPTCSVACRTIVQHGKREAPTDSYTWRVDAAKRARRYGAPIVQVFDREDIFNRDGWACCDCGIQCAAPNPYDRTAATVDHVVPLHFGGEHSRANAQTLCLSCNTRKADRITAAA